MALAVVGASCDRLSARGAAEMLTRDWYPARAARMMFTAQLKLRPLQ